MTKSIMNLTRSLTVLQGVLLILSASRTAYSREIIYELKGNDMCNGVGVQNQHVSVLCEVTNLSQLCDKSETAQLKWMFVSPSDRRPVRFSEKYTIWEDEKYDYISSVVRVNDIDPDADQGMLTCSLYCDAKTEPVFSYKLELCVQDAATGLISCSLSTTEDSCTLTFADGTCDEKCNSVDQLYDGDDCDSYREDTCSYTVTDCLTGFGDNACNGNCSSPQCGSDGGDCLPDAQSITRETLAVVVPNSFTDVQIKLLSLELSIKLATLVKLHGNATSWTANNNQNIQAVFLNPAVFQVAGNQLKMVEYELVPQTCRVERCFLRVRNAAKYIGHHLTRNNKYINSSVAVLGIKSDVDNCYISKPRDMKSPYIANLPNHGKSDKGQTTLKTSGSKNRLGVGEIAGISLCGLAVVLLVIGIGVACRYRRIAIERQKSQSINKETQVKEYIESIPTDISSDGSSTSGGGLKSPPTSITRSVTSKDTTLPQSVSRTQNYKFEEDA